MFDDIIKPEKTSYNKTPYDKSSLVNDLGDDHVCPHEPDMMKYCTSFVPCRTWHSSVSRTECGNYQPHTGNCKIK